jgi:hypothetical protein
MACVFSASSSTIWADSDWWYYFKMKVPPFIMNVGTSSPWLTQKWKLLVRAEDVPPDVELRLVLDGVEAPAAEDTKATALIKA